jgi:hypothetical protein
MQSQLNLFKARHVLFSVGNLLNRGGIRRAFAFGFVLCFLPFLFAMAKPNAERLILDGTGMNDF